jgi:hypothetical protein
MGVGSALAFGAYGAIRYRDARVILRYRRNIRRLPRYVMTSKDVPVSQQRLFVGRGFLWEQKHTHRLMQTYRPEFRRYVEPTPAYRLARRLEERLEFAPFPLSRLPALTGWDVPFNPRAPAAAGRRPAAAARHRARRGGRQPAAGRARRAFAGAGHHARGQDAAGRVVRHPGHPPQERRGEHEVVIVIDPKGDADLLKRMYVEAQRAGREGEFYIFHLGWPEISARYNAVGRFGRISEVATRIAGQLSGEGNSAAFREFAWRFVNIIARALVELGQRPDYMLIQRHVINIDALFIEYAQHYFAKTEPKAWEVIVQIEAKLNEKNIPRNMIGREKRVVALEQYLSQARNYDPVLDGLRSCSPLRQDLLRQDRRIAAAAAGEAHQRQDRPASGAELLRPGRPTSDLRLDAGHPKARHRLCGPGCALRRRGRRSSRQLDVQRSRVGRRPHLQARDRRRPAGCIGRRARADQRPCRRIQ